jgi:hypothetical protein
MAKYKTSDQVTLKNALQGIIRIRRGSTVGGATTPCTRQLPPNPPSFPAMTEICPNRIFATRDLVASISVSPVIGDAFSQAYYQRTFNLALTTHTPGLFTYWEGFANVSLSIEAVCDFGFVCATGSWYLGFYPTNSPPAVTIYDFAALYGASQAFPGFSPLTSQAMMIDGVGTISGSATVISANLPGTSYPNTGTSATATISQP